MAARILTPAERVTASRRSTVKIVGVAYLVASAVACMMLVAVEVLRADYWKAWHFWPFFLTPLNVLVGALFLEFAASTCSCGGANLVAVVVGVVHFLWSLVVIGFSANDLLLCSSRPWCTVAPSTTFDPYFLTWFIAFGVAALLELIMCVLGARLYSAAKRQCPGRVCTRRGYAGGVGYAGGAGVGGIAGGGVPTTSPGSYSALEGGDYGDDGDDSTFAAELGPAQRALTLQASTLQSAPQQQQSLRTLAHVAPHETPGMGTVVFGDELAAQMRATFSHAADNAARKHS